jgi:hypothetical protein
MPKSCCRRDVALFCRQIGVPRERIEETVDAAFAYGLRILGRIKCWHAQV